MSNNPKNLRWMYICFLVFITLFQGNSQCPTCKPDTTIVPTGNFCNAIVNPITLLSSPALCNGVTVSVMVFSPSGVNLGNTIPSAFIGIPLKAIVTNTQNNVTCQTYVISKDLTKPQVGCQDISVPCHVDADSIGLPFAMDECTPLGNFKYQYVDQKIQGSCALPAIIQRTWTVTDLHGNTATCSQKITFQKVNLSDVVFALTPDITLNCGEDMLNFSLTGSPIINGIPILPQNHCDIKVEIPQDTLNVPQGKVRIVRHWTLTDTCTKKTANINQFINYSDPDAPVIQCPGTLLIVNKNPVILPSAITSDPCTGITKSLILGSWGGSGVGPHQVPIGDHIVTYTVFDLANNSSSCTINLKVQNANSSAFNCINFPVIQLNSNGNAVVPAGAFVQGNSSGIITVKKAFTLDPFLPSVSFNCSIVNDTIPIWVRRQDSTGMIDTCLSMAIIKDKIAPSITFCPKDTTVKCTELKLNALEAYGDIAAVDNCGAADSIWEVVSNNLSQCKIGTLTRTFFARDSSGNISTCSQLITVIAADSIKEAHVTWPENYTIHTCTKPASLVPDSLPAPYNKPIINFNECGLIAVGYTDEVFTVSQPACYKIRRVWTVCDLCLFNPAIPNSPGKLMHVQYIMVTDNTPPVISCPVEVVIPIGPTCGNTKADLIPVTAMDCDPNVKITNNSIYATSKGANASGVYPPGTTLVTFVAKDACHNSSECTMKVVVTDKTAPDPVCKLGLATDVGLMQDSSVWVNIPAKFFVDNAPDNCTPSAKLKFSYSTNVLDSVYQFNCDSLGKHFFIIYVTDEAGNQTFCKGSIEIQDNYKLCKGSNVTGGGGTLSGNITNPEGIPMEQTLVSILEMPGASYVTGPDGQFSFNGANPKQTYTIVPEKNIHPLNGVNTYDIVLLQKHLLGLKPLSDPWKVLAADVNQSRSLSVVDAVLMRKLILHLIPAFDAVPSWRLIPKNWMIPSTGILSADSIPCMSHTKAGEPSDFIAVKSGDLDGNALPGQFQNTLETRNEGIPFAIEIANTQFRAGEYITVPIVGLNQDNIYGFQMAFQIQSDLLEYEGIKGGATTGLNASHISMLASGDLRISYSEALPFGVQPGKPIFSIVFKAKKDGIIGKAITLNQESMPAQAYRPDHSVDQVIPIQCYIQNSNSNQTPGTYTLYANRPNPFRQSTMIPFYLEKEGSAQLEILDVSGKVIWKQEVCCGPGYEEVEVSEDHFPAKGVYFYRLLTEAWQATRMMVKE